MACLAQKKYVFLEARNSDLKLKPFDLIDISGAIPKDMNKQYKDVQVGDVLNQLASHGFQVEKMESCPVGATLMKVCIILSVEDGSLTGAVDAKPQARPAEKDTNDNDIASSN